MSPRTALLATLLAALAFSVPLHAQEDDGSLYFPPELDAMLTAWIASDSGGSYETIREIVVYEYGTYRELPLLPMLFFDAGSAEIPARYVTFPDGGGAFDWSDTCAPTADYFEWYADAKYYDVLNVIGYRLQKYSDAVLTLEGGYSTEVGENAELARLRCDVVRDYMVRVWSIDEDRFIYAEPRRTCDSADNVFTMEEARRVRFDSDDWRLLEPVRYVDNSEAGANVWMDIVVHPRVAPDKVDRIELRLIWNDSVISAVTMAGDRDSTAYENGVDLYGDLRRFAQKEIELEATVWLHDGRKRTSNRIGFPLVVRPYIDADYLQTIDWYEHDDEEDGYDDRGEEGGDEDAPNNWYGYLTLPFFDAGADTLSSYQKRLLAHVARPLLDLPVRPVWEPDPGENDRASQGNPAVDAFGEAIEENENGARRRQYAMVRGNVDGAENRHADGVELASIGMQARMFGARCVANVSRWVPESLGCEWYYASSYEEGYEEDDVDWDLYEARQAAFDSAYEGMMLLAPSPSQGEALRKMRLLGTKRAQAVAGALRFLAERRIVDTVHVYSDLREEGVAAELGDAGLSVPADTDVSTEPDPYDSWVDESTFMLGLTPERRYYDRSVEINLGSYPEGFGIEDWIGGE